MHQGGIVTGANRPYEKESVIEKRLTGTRIQNKAKLKAFELVDPRNTELRIILQKAEFAQMAGDDVVKEEDEDEGPTGSGSDSE